jgi:hypothetical protein
MRVMQMPGDEKVDVISVRNGLVTAPGTVYVPLLMPAARMRGRARCRVLRARRDRALVDVIGVHTVQVPIVQVIGVPIMHDGLVTASRSVRMGMVWVRLVVGHWCLLGAARAAMFVAG